MRVFFQVGALVLLTIVGIGIVVLVNAPKWFDARPTPTSQPVAATPTR